ncbi:hypothetical protein [Deinococcus wulumuqiensis]|uniref:hypothetical protein n=1 Tax=Deinococcus wulumuqiensis TaxID=980427 RepID=UPI0013C35E19|nr:hypothetical protein [Deinococcus wulumuqiensis]
MVSHARNQAEAMVYRILGEIITGTGHEQALDDLLNVPEDQAMAPFTRLKQWPRHPKPANILKLIERLNLLWQFPVNDPRLGTLPRSRLDGLAAEGKRLSTSSLSEYAPAKRRAVIFARLVELSQTLTDEVLEMHDRLMLTYLRESGRASITEYGLRQEVEQELTLRGLLEAFETVPGERLRCHDGKRDEPPP